jgi:hypothetical protein
MPSARIANDIRRSLAPGETYEDFAYMFDTLLAMRTPSHTDYLLNEQITARLLCVVFPDKPAHYVSSMQQFRMTFAGIANDPDLQMQFSSRVMPAALTVQSLEEITWQAHQYFLQTEEAQGYEQS